MRAALMAPSRRTRHEVSATSTTVDTSPRRSPPSSTPGQILPRQRPQYLVGAVTGFRAMGVRARHRERAALAKHRQQQLIIGHAHAHAVSRDPPSITANSWEAGTTIVRGPGQNSSDRRCARSLHVHINLLHRDSARAPARVAHGRGATPSRGRATPRHRGGQRGGDAVDSVGGYSDHGALEEQSDRFVSLDDLGHRRATKMRGRPERSSRSST